MKPARIIERDEKQLAKLGGGVGGVGVITLPGKCPDPI